MAYEHTPGRGRLFRNTQRNGKQPHISGTAKLPDGRTIRIAVWDNSNDQWNVQVEYKDESAEEPTHRMSAQQQQWEREGKSIFTGVPKKMRSMDEA
jgi:hypothetical protein